MTMTKKERGNLVLIANAIDNVWDQVGPDAAEAYGEDISSDAAVEICLDADRLLTFGSAYVHGLFRELVEKHGYTKIYRALCKKVSLGI